MKKTLTVLITLLMCACSTDKLNYLQDEKSNDNSDVLHFVSKEEFTKSLNDFDYEKSFRTRGLTNFVSLEDIYEKDEEDISDIGFLVPDYKFRNFLNKNSEIVVQDTIYKITNKGTFYTSLNNRDELYTAIDKFDEFEVVNPKLRVYRNTKVIDSFNIWNGENTPITNDKYFEDDEYDTVIEDVVITRASKNDGGISEDEIKKFPVIGTVNVSILDKIIRFSPSYLGSSKFRFKSNKRRKLYASVYKYDYAFGVSIGLDFKVMKKLWHGMKWGRMKNWEEGIYYGVNSLVVEQKVKHISMDKMVIEPYKSSINKQWNHYVNSQDKYYDTSRYFENGFQSKWIPEYNKKKTQYVIPYLGEIAEFSNSESLAKQIDKFLIKKGVNKLRNVVNNNKNSTLEVTLLDPQNDKIYSFFKNDLSWNGGGYRVKETFLRYQRNINLTIGYTDGKMKSPSVSISDNDFIGSPKIISCDAVVYTKDGDGWIGARIISNPN